MDQVNDFYYVSAPKRKVYLIDALIQKHKDLKCGNYIQTENDWEIAINLYEFWKQEYPEEFEFFKKV